MKMAVFLSGLMLSMAVMSCAGADTVSDGQKVFQRVEVGNGGSVAVTEASVLYGPKELLLGPAVQSFPAGDARRHTFGQGFDSIIPEQTELHWVTAGQGSHDATIATRSLVRNRGAFYGFRFYFVNDHVDVYLIERVPNPSHFLSLKYTKVYSSTRDER